MIDADGVDDAVLLASYAFEAADPLAAVAEGADALDGVRAVEGSGDVVPDGVGRPGVVGGREHVDLVARGAELCDEALSVCEHLLVDGLCIGETVPEGVRLGVLDDDGRGRGRVLRGEEEEGREESEGGEEGVAGMPLEDGRHGGERSGGDEDNGELDNGDDDDNDEGKVRGSEREKRGKRRCL